MKGIPRDMRFYEHQADVTLSQASPGPGVEYAVLSSTFVRIISASAVTTWTVQNNPLELHVTLDGNVLECSHANPVSTTVYSMSNINPGAASWSLETPTTTYRAFVVEGKVCVITAETTGGTVSNLSSRIKYARFI